jgi:hypothetical protein
MKVWCCLFDGDVQRELWEYQLNLHARNMVLLYLRAEQSTLICFNCFCKLEIGYVNK